MADPTETNAEAPASTAAADMALANLMNLGRATHEKRAKARGSDEKYGDDGAAAKTGAEGGEETGAGETLGGEQGQQAKAPPEPQEKETTPASKEGFKQLREHKKKLEDDLAAVNQQLKDKDGNINALQAEKTELLKQIEETKKMAEDARKHRDAIDFMTSEEIEERFIVPVNQAVSTLATKFKEYGVAESVLQEAINMTSVAEIEEHIESNISSKRLKDLVYDTFDKIGELNRARAAAEKAPSESLQRIRNERKLAKERETTLAIEALSSDSHSAFQEALLFNRAQGDLALPSFLEDPENAEHNEKVYKPAVARAKEVLDTLLQPFKANGIRVSKEYLTFMSRLAQAGSVATTEFAGRMAYAGELASANSRIQQLEKEIESYKAKGNPSPRQAGTGAGGSSGGGSNGSTFKGNNSQERLGDFLGQFKNGKL